MIFGLHPVATAITGFIVGLLALTPLIFWLLDRAGRLTPQLRAELWKRYRSWLVLAPLMAGPVLLGRIPSILAVALLALLCFGEFARATGLFRNRLVTAVVSLGILLTFFSVLDRWHAFFGALVSLTTSVIVIVSLLPDRPQGYIQRVALGVFAYLLFGVCLGHFAYFANDVRGPALLLAILLCVELNDVFAYCTGKLFGRRKLAPNTSPNKTLAGALGALVLTTAFFAFLISHIYENTGLAAPLHGLAMGAILSFTGQCGDLVLSSIKRDLGLKDMAATIPGHGGLLDRFDSLLFVGPALFHYIMYFFGVAHGLPERLYTSPL